MDWVKPGWTLTLGVALAISACAYSVTSTFDPWKVDGGIDSNASGTITSTELPMPAPSVSGSSSGGVSQSTHDAALIQHNLDASVIDGASTFDTGSVRVIGGEASIPCNAQTCSGGCCDTGGRCQGALDTACGKGGASCIDCTLAGGTCKSGSCSTSTSSSSSSSSSGGRGGGINLLGCNPIICWYGCCQGDGTCAVSGNTTCGTLGSQCVDCTKSQKTCLVGACL